MGTDARLIRKRVPRLEMNGAVQVRSDPRPGRQLGQEATASGELGGMSPAFMGASGRMNYAGRRPEKETTMFVEG